MNNEQKKVMELMKKGYVVFVEDFDKLGVSQ